MRLLSSYDVIIFDCDGVILDSNEFKINAMEDALITCKLDENTVKKCVDSFRYNFGKSRFFHVDFFVNEIICPGTGAEDLKNALLIHYSFSCSKLYANCSETPMIRPLLESLTAKLYIASGSEQSELRSVMHEKGLMKYFLDVLGSPKPKTEIINCIVNKFSEDSNIVMIGDAESDFLASNDNDIDFIFYSPFSNVKEKMLSLGQTHDFSVIQAWEEVL
jgi:phosphoglycolate phosphatase-like HAD superfamily hydrolase